MRKQDEKRTNEAELRRLRKIARISFIRQQICQKKATNEQTDGLDTWTECQQTDFHFPHKTMYARFAEKRNKGRPRMRWIYNINEDLTRLGVTLRGAPDLT